MERGAWHTVHEVTRAEHNLVIKQPTKAWQQPGCPTTDEWIKKMNG